jgi:8-oxo-dGTP pyrophosphatase MutT (NUDIX family)
MDEEEKYRKEHPKRDVAVVGIRDGAGRVFLVRTHKLTEWWQPIGGGVDPEDASPQAAAVREIKEELGVEIKLADLKLKIETPYDFGEGTVYFYEVEMDPEVNFEIDSVEIVDYKWFSPSEAQYLKAFPATMAYLRTLA